MLGWFCSVEIQASYPSITKKCGMIRTLMSHSHPNLIRHKSIKGLFGPQPVWRPPESDHQQNIDREELGRNRQQNGHFRKTTQGNCSLSPWKYWWRVGDLNPWPSGCDNYAQKTSSIFSNIFQRWPANHPLLFLITERCVSWAMVQIWHTNVIVFILTYPANTTLCFYVSERKISLFSLTNSCSIFPSVARGGQFPLTS